MYICVSLVSCVLCVYISAIYFMCSISHFKVHSIAFNLVPQINFYLLSTFKIGYMKQCFFPRKPNPFYQFYKETSTWENT